MTMESDGDDIFGSTNTLSGMFVKSSCCLANFKVHVFLFLAITLKNIL